MADVKKASTFQLVFLVYAVICSGAYGLEEMVSASGPGLALAVIMILPLLYAAPISLVCAELAARHPIEGGYYRWVRMAFGDFPGYLAGWLVWLTMFTANAAFAVNFASYLRHFVPELGPYGQLAVSVALVWIATLINYRGIQVVGIASVVLTFLIFLPFAALTLLGLLRWSHDPFAPFVHPEKSVVGALGDGLMIAMYLYGGFEKLTANAGEVENPRRAFPIALSVAVPMCVATYLVPTFAALAANGDWAEWTEGYFAVAAERVGGAPLGAAMAAGGLVSNFCILMVTILAQSRLPMVLAQDGMFPAVFAKRHPRYDTPVPAILLGGVILTPLCLFRFAELAGLYSLVQALSYVLIYAAFFKLRRAGDAAAGAFRIPLSSAAVAALAAPTVVLAALVVGRGLFHDAGLDLRQVLIDAVLFGSGPLSYYLFKRGRT